MCRKHLFRFFPFTVRLHFVSVAHFDETNKNVNAANVMMFISIHFSFSKKNSKTYDRAHFITREIRWYVIDL